jgi:dihydroorotate dehydrogenase
MSGIVLVNTLPDIIKINGKRVHGGRSGPFLMEYGIEAVSTVYSHTNGKLPIVGVGGVETADDVLKYIKTGASLVQLYTGFINHGPKLPAKILDGVLKKLNNNQKIEDIVGVWS